MKYKGYMARIEYSEEDSCFVGHLAGITDIVGFHGDTVAALKIAFEEAVDDYLETCKVLDKQPQLPAPEEFMIIVPSNLQDTLMKAAKRRGKSINQWATDVLIHAAQA